MEQKEIIERIEQKEREAKEIIEQAKLKASSIIQGVKFTKRKDIFKTAEEEADREIQRLKQEYRKKKEEAIKRIDEETMQRIDKIIEVTSKNRDKAKDYIVDELLKIWQLQR